MFGHRIPISLDHGGKGLSGGRGLSSRGPGRGAGRPQIWSQIFQMFIFRKRYCSGRVFNLRHISCKVSLGEQGGGSARGRGKGFLGEVLPPPSSSLLLSSLELSNTQVYEPWIRTLLGTASHLCEVVVLQARTVPNGATLTLRILLVIRRGAQAMYKRRKRARAREGLPGGGAP